MYVKLFLVTTLHMLYKIYMKRFPLQLLGLDWMHLVAILQNARMAK